MQVMVGRGPRRVAVVAIVALVLGVLVPTVRAPAAEARSLLPFAGLGAWVDRFDWSVTHGGASPAIGLASIDEMAAQGVRTVYLQTATPGSSGLLEPTRLRALIDRAHARGMAVVGWHLPKLVDPAADLASLLAMRSVGVDAIGVDIEDLSVGDVGERNRRLVQLSRDLRAAAPEVTLSAIVLPPVVTDVLNTSYWPDFPYGELAEVYDVWQPMAYWTNRPVGSVYRDGHRYIAENIDRLRQHTGRPDLPVHPVGGLADLASQQEVAGMVLAASQRGALGISLYDQAITRPDLWPTLRSWGGAPFGAVDQVSGGPRSIVLGGWAVDPDTAGPVEVHVYVDGVGRANVLADRDRPDLASHLPAYGTRHGFRAVIDGLAAGNHRVCAYAVGVGAGGTTELTCQRVHVASGSPRGAVDRVEPGVRSVRVAGWAQDPDVAGPIDVHVYIDGVGRASLPADRHRPDLRAPFPGWGGLGGFDVVIPDVAPGPHVVCTFGIDQGPGSNRLLDCREVVVSHDPVGVIDRVDAVGPGTLRVQGWMLDPDVPGPISSHLYVDGAGWANVVADGHRPDVAAAVGGTGAAHGLDVLLTGLAPGPHVVCAFAIDVGPGDDVLLECRDAVVPTGSPIGVVDAVRPGPVPGSARVRGWTLDPDTADPARVHVYVDGIGRANVVADGSRPDVAAVFPGWGAAHGYDVVVDGLTPGEHVVCTFGVDPVGTHAARLLRCDEVTVPGGPPVGAVDAVSAVAPGGISVAGWAVDPDVVDAVDVHVYVDGVGAASTVADRAGAAPAPWAGWGPAHRFAVTVDGLAPGGHVVCAFAIDAVDPASSRLLACHPVEVVGAPGAAPGP